MSSLEMAVAEADLAVVVGSDSLFQDLEDVDLVLCLDRDLPEGELLLLQDCS